MGGTGSQWLVGVTGVRQRGPLRRLLAELGGRAETDPAQCLGGRRWGRARVERGKVPVLSLGRGPVSRGPMGQAWAQHPVLELLERWGLDWDQEAEQWLREGLQRPRGLLKEALCHQTLESRAARSPHGTQQEKKSSGHQEGPRATKSCTKCW